MPGLTTEEKLEYILTVLANCNALKANYQQVASLTNLSSAHKAQVKFKKLVESTGRFKLVNQQIISVDEDTADEEIPAVIQPHRFKKDKVDKTGAETERATKKRKRNTDE